MRFIRSTRGFSLIEVMIAVVVLTVGLTGVAAMQITALNGTFYANSSATGSGIALAWTEWLNGLVSHTDQDKINYFDTGRLYRQNFVGLSMLDYNPDDPDFAELVLPSSMDEVLDFFNGVRPFTMTNGYSIEIPFRKEGGTLFTAEDMPPLAPEGASIRLRIAANVPVINTATIEVAVVYANAFVKNRGATLRFIVASNM